MILAVYSYNFFWGGYLKYNEVKNGDELYTGGQILGIMFCVITGAFQITAIGPHLKSVTEGKIAGKLAFDVIDANPSVEPKVKNGIVLKND